MARGGGQDLPRAGTLPRRKPPDTAHEQKNLPRARTLPSAKASRHGARAKGFAPRRNTPHGKGLPTRRTGERICPARERSPRRRPPDTAHERKDLPRSGTLPTAKASRTAHGRKNLPRGVRVHPACRRTAGRSRPTNSRKNTPSAGSHPRPRTSERICPAQKRSPRRRPPDTTHERKDLPRAETLPSAKASRHGARAKGFAPRGSRSPHVPTNGGPPSTDGQPEKHPFGGVAPETARPLPSSFTEKNKTTP